MVRERMCKYILVTILLCSVELPSEAKYGADCMTPAEHPGKCMPLKSCAGAFELLLNILKFGEARFKNEIAFLQQSHCDSINGNPLVCCPSDDIQIDPWIYEHLRSQNCGSSGTSKVSNGQKAGLFQYRWMALLKYNDKDPFACSGSLIDERYVLTAAHCLHNFTNLPVAVRLGEYNLSNETDCISYRKGLKCLDPVQDIGIEEIIPHEDYIYLGIHHDIALLRLERPVKLTKHIRPICLPISHALQTAEVYEYLVAGWGLTEREIRSDVLTWAYCPNRPREFCQQELGVTLSKEHICAGGRKFRDTCKGDSGGPLFYPNIYVDGVARSIQYGIVSFGADICGQMNVPAVYINVSQNIQWITDHMRVEGSHL